MDFSIIGIWCLAGRRRNGGSLACREYIREQERVMAAIFGFPEFFAAGPGGERREGREPVNHFGCWVRYIEE